ncbi:suppressor of fused domain protein [Tsukamurella sp. 1534]|uniref:suppressor of fused domain protein n=1 Tax=Tsukamurella sp. 1534 TaxID=1151061 RepID=UPI0002EEA20A|nr:suppressor of fused domain protein [Tsukamurella sp. 1534]
MALVDDVRTHLNEHYGARGFAPPASASVTFLGLAPMTVQRWVGDGAVAFASLGCSQHPMTDPDALVTAEDGPRAEVVVELRPAPNGPGAALDGVHRAVAILAASPAVEGLVLAPDALVDLGQPLWAGAPFTAVLLGPSTVPDLPTGGEPVRFLRADPITANEAAWVRLKGADGLREAWAEAGIDPADPGRPAARAV